MTKRKLLPFVVVAAVLVGCAQLQGGLNSSDFLVQEARYTGDAKDIAAYRKDKPVDPSILALEGTSYKALNASRAAGYTTDSVTALRQSLVVLETEMASKGVKGYASRPVGAH